MIMTCELCGNDFLTEADPYVIRPTSKGYLHYCSCMVVGHDQISGIDKLEAENKKLRDALEVAFEDFKKQGYHKQANKIFKVLKK